MSDAPARRRLGRGLEALLGVSSVEAAEREGSLRELPVEDIRPNRYQPRRTVDEAALAELTQSLRQNGLLQPIVVRPLESGYEIVAGERRWRAARELGWQRVPAVVREVDDQTLLTLALVENLQRASLTPIDEAEGYDRLIRDFHLSHGAVAEAVGRDRSTVSNALRLLKLPDTVQQLVSAGALSAGHARALLALEDERHMARLASECVARDWSVREIERRTRSGPSEPRGKEAKARWRVRRASAEIRRIEEALRRHFGTDATVVVQGKARGYIAMRFFSNEDLARLLEKMLGRRWDG